MTGERLCLGPETVAAFAEGRLKRHELAPVLEHLDACGACMAAVEIISANDEPRQRAWTRFVPYLAAAAAIAVIALTLPLLRPRPPIARLVALAPASERIVEPRLAGGFAWAPYRGPNRATSDAVEPQRWKLTGAAGEIVDEANRVRSSAAEHAAGVAMLLMERPADAIPRLRAAAQDAPHDAARWNDLAAAQYAAARTLERPSLYPQALASCDRAIAADATLAEALFNRALILERMGLTQEARAAWNRYLQRDPSSRWAAEAQRRLAALPLTTGEERFQYDQPRLERAALSGDRASVVAMVERDRQRARAWGEAEYLGRWGEAVQQGSAGRAAEALTIARAIGDALIALTGESLLHDAVHCIDTAPPAQRASLAEAHVSYRKGRMAYARQELQPAEDALRHAAGLFADADDPMALLARYFAENARFDSNDITGARAALEALLVEADARPQYAALGASIRWQLVTCAIAELDFPAALPLATAATATFHRLGERGNTAYMESMVASAYLYGGETELGWAARIRAFGILDTERNGDRLAVAILEAVRLELGERRFDSARALLTIEESVVAATHNETLINYVFVQEAVVAAHDGDASGAARAVAMARASALRIPDRAMRERALADHRFAEGAAALSEDPARADALLTLAIDHYRETKRFLLLPESLLLRARARMRLGRLDAAADDLESGMAAVERRPFELGAAIVGTGALDAGRTLFEEAVRLHADRGDPAGVFDAIERQRARLVRTSPGDARPRLDALRERLGTSGTAVLEAMPLDDEMVVLAITSREARLTRSAVARDALASLPMRALYDLIVRPAEATLAGARALVVVAGEPLQSVPFGALYDVARKQRLIERLPVATAESASSLRVSTSGGPPHTLTSIALAARGAAPLPELRAEVADLRPLYRASVELQGDQVTLDSLIAAAAGADVLHVAGHTAEQPGSGERTLDLAGERVSSQSLAARSLRRPVIVVLSACETLRPRAQSRSLGAGFLAAGASTVIGTLTPIPDGDARAIFAAIHRHLAAGDSPAVAVQRAQLEAIAHESRGSESLPWQSVVVLTNRIPDGRS
jgi:tetratricopeptide (TPR) repeat protein